MKQMGQNIAIALNSGRFINKTERKNTKEERREKKKEKNARMIRIDKTSQFE